MKKFKPYAELDLNKLGVLPKNWKEDIYNLLDVNGKLTVLRGDSSTSREEKDVEMDVWVVEGGPIKEKLRWLYELYSGVLKEFSEEAFNTELFTSNSIRTSVNINCIKGFGARYEWHVDSNPVTGLLFVNSLGDDSGGELLFNKDDKCCLVVPKEGLFICFDAREIPHFVKPLKLNISRCSIPMNFYTSPNDQIRPDDLDNSIY